MTEVTTPERELSYRYNFKGQRAEKIEDGQSRYYLYDQNNLLVAEIAADGSVAKEYIYLEGEPLAMLVDGQLYYYHNSHLGTPLLLSDAQQQVVWQAEYSAFGKAEVQVATIENNLRFPGQYFDEETGLHYNYFRDYDPQTGRYLQSDPIGLAGGINTYGYVGGNPVNYVDEHGLYRRKIKGACFVITIGAFALDMGGVRSAVVGAFKDNPYQKEVEKMNAQLDEWEDEAKQCTDPIQKGRYQQAISGVEKTRNDLARQAAEWNVNNSFGGKAGVAGLAFVVAGAACGSL